MILALDACLGACSVAVLDDRGVHLLDVLRGPGGVLTGSARERAAAHDDAATGER